MKGILFSEILKAIEIFIAIAFIACLLSIAGLDFSDMIGITGSLLSDILNFVNPFT